jgi:hypothetical protein
MVGVDCHAAGLLRCSIEHLLEADIGADVRLHHLVERVALGMSSAKSGFPPESSFLLTLHRRQTAIHL